MRAPCQRNHCRHDAHRHDPRARHRDLHWSARSRTSCVCDSSNHRCGARELDSHVGQVGVDHCRQTLPGSSKHRELKGEQEAPRGRRCCAVRRWRRGEYVFAPHAEIDRFLWHARQPFDDAQLTALSNSASRAARRPPTPSTATRARSAQGCQGDLPTHGRARAGSVSSRLSTVFRRTRVLAGHTDAVVARRRRHCRRLFRVTPPSSTTSRARAAAVSPRCPCVRSSRSPSSPRRQAGRPRAAAQSQGARSQERCRVGAREDAAAATAATQAVSSEQLNSFALRVAVGKRARDFRNLEV